MPSSPTISAVVANTGPIIALWLGEQLPLLPRALKSVHVPREEVQEWKRTIAKLQKLRAQTPALDTDKLIEQWIKEGFLHQHDPSITQINRAEKLNHAIHPDAPNVHFVDGYAVSLAQALVDQGTVQALMADEKNLRKVAKNEGIHVVGSLWLVRLLYENGAINKTTAESFPDVVARRGQFYSGTLIKQFKQSLVALRRR